MTIKKVLIAIIAATVIATYTASAGLPNKTDYIGYRHAGVLHGEILSNGARYLGGGLVSNEDFGVTEYSVGKKRMLWLEELTHLDDAGVPHWVVRDVLAFDRFSTRNEFLYSYSSPCTIDGVEDLDLVVMVEKQKKNTKVLKAWRADTTTGRFDEASISSVVCE
jgi:hypothetical protein